MNTNTINNDVTIGGAQTALLANRYRIVRQLGQGGMGSVWLAEDTQLDGKLFAVKMLPSILVSNKRAYSQLKAEALVSMKLTHPNIVTLRAFEENNGNPFLVMDYIRGKTLDRCLVDWDVLNEMELVSLLRPVAEALDYAHAKGVVHRDVKPGNVMVAEDGTPYVLDFGIAREIQETMTHVTGKFSSGTLLYMSPEQLNGASPKKEQDIYSFAAMAYECLKGNPPFHRGQIEYQIMNNPPEPLDASGAQSIARGVMAGLAKNPEERPETCAAVLTGEGVRVVQASVEARHPRNGANGGMAAGRRAVASEGHNSGHGGAKKRSGLTVAIWLLVFCVLGGGIGLMWLKGGRMATTQTVEVSSPMHLPSVAPSGPTGADIAEIAVEAKVQKRRIERIDDADGFKARKDILSDLFAEAEEFAKLEHWDKVAASFTNYVDGCRDLVGLDEARQKALLAKKTHADAQKRAEEAEASRYASERWRAAAGIAAAANGQFGAFGFAEAEKLYRAAARECEIGAKEAECERTRQEADRARKQEAARKEEERRVQDRLAKLEAAKKICKKCHGDGRILVREPCVKCQGARKGKKEKECFSCKGDGVVSSKTVCHTCEGKRQVRTSCSSCGSNGSVACSSCNGQGFVRSRKYVSGIQGRNLSLRVNKNACSSCKGTGRERCWSCGDNQYETCTTCEGTGSRTSERDCASCAGSGKISFVFACSDCTDGYAYLRKECTLCQGEGKRILGGTEVAEPFDGIAVAKPIVEEYLPVTLVRVAKVPGGWRAFFQIADDFGEDGCSRQNQRCVSVREGEKIGLTGWIFDTYESKTSHQKVEGASGLIRAVDVSEAVLMRPSDRKIVRCPVGRNDRITVGGRATLRLCSLTGRKKDVEVETGSVFSLDGKDFTVDDIASSTVVISGPEGKAKKIGLEFSEVK